MKRPLVWMGCAVLAAVWMTTAISPPRLYSAESARSELIGRVKDRRFQNNSYILELHDIKKLQNNLEFNSNENNKIHGVLVYIDEGSTKIPKIGQKIKVKGQLEPFEKARDPGQFDMAEYRRIHDIDCRMVKPQIIASSRSFDHICEMCKEVQEACSGIFDALMKPSDAGICKAMVVGDKTGLDSDIKSLYQRVGIAHVLSISGLHISILGFGLYALLKRLQMPRMPSAAISCTFLMLYSIVCGGATSARRSVIMFILCVIAENIGRSYDILSALTLSMIIILLSDPLLSRDTGFLLSFGAVSGIGILNPYLSELIPYSNNKIVSGIICSVSVTLFTLPVILLSFYQISFNSVFLNIVIVPLMGILMCSALAVIGFCSLHLRFLAKIAAAICHLLLALFERLARISDASGGRIVMGKPEAGRIVLYYFLMLLMLFCLEKCRNIGKKRALAAGMAAVMIMLMAFRVHSGFKYMMIDIGQGSCNLLLNEDGSVILVDCGSTDVKDVAKYRVIPCLKSMGIDKIDYAIVTHSDKDHISGFEEMMTMEKGESLPIKTLVMPYLKSPDDNYKRLVSTAKEAKVGVKYISAGDVIKDGRLVIECLHPSKDFTYEDVNSYSTVLDVRYGAFSALLTGDVVGNGEDEVEKRMDRGYTLLEVAHHGSKYSSEDSFLEKAMPKISFISSGVDNSYGHPHKETMDRLKKINTKIFLTKEDGAISLWTDGKKIRIKTFLKGAAK